MEIDNLQTASILPQLKKEDHDRVDSGSSVSPQSQTQSLNGPEASGGRLSVSMSPSDDPKSLRRSELKVLDNGKVMKVQKTRQRKILSCVYCHSKKIKCSRIHPICNNCEKLGVECKYFINERISRGGKKSARLSEEEKEHRAGLLKIAMPQSDNYTVTERATDRNSFSSTESILLSPHDTYSEDRSQRSRVTDISSSSPASKSRSLNQPEVTIDITIKDSPAMGHDLNPMSYYSANNQPSDSNATNTQNYSNPSQQVSNSVLQTPIMNNVSNNITNNFFNTNYSNQASSTLPSTVSSTQNAAQQSQTNKPNDESYSFNLSSFTFNNETLSSTIPITQSNSQSTQNLAYTSSDSPNLPSNLSHSNINAFFSKNASNFLDGTTNAVNPINIATPSNTSNESPEAMSHMRDNQQQISYSFKHQPVNPGLHNSLNAFPSNPATTINYLYGTNTYYENNNLLSDLLQHLPSSKERSYELMDRYVNSVHILLPILINLNDFLKIHELYWEIRSGENKNQDQITAPQHSPSSPGSQTSSSTSSSTPGSGDIDYLQFYTLYFPILYASTISEFEEYDNLLLNQDINKYLKGFNKICQYYNYPHGLKTIPLLLGNVIIQSTSPNPSAMEMSQIIRYSKFLQMHKDPLITLGIKDWEVVKFRRLLWWIIFGLDALTSHNFCLPPNCKFEDFNVLMPDDEEPVEGTNERKLNIGILSINIKFKYDRILSELVYHLHNGLSTNITSQQIHEIKLMIIDLFKFINKSFNKMNHHLRMNPPQTVQEINLINFVKNHSWSFVDRALMLLHKKMLMSDGDQRDFRDSRNNSRTTSRNEIPEYLRAKTHSENEYYDRGDTRSVVRTSSPHDDMNLVTTQNHQPARKTSKVGKTNSLSLSQYEDTFGDMKEANIINNLNNSSISSLRFNQSENFTYDNINNNLIPSILHNLNDFLKYNDFIKFGKFNWYVKRTIPLDSIILMFIIINVKFKYGFMTLSELSVYVKLINKALFILNRKWFKNEKYKRMLSLTNLTWEFILKRYNIVQLVSQFSDNNKLNSGNQASGAGTNTYGGRMEFFDYQVTSYMNMNDLFNIMDVPQPVLAGEDDLYQDYPSRVQNHSSLKRTNEHEDLSKSLNQANNQLAISSTHLSLDTKTELIRLNEKIYYDLRNNFVDVNDYCAFYTSLENILHELMDFILRA